MSDAAADDALLVAAVAGDPAALRALYECLAPRVHGYLRARGAVDSEDLTSEVFLAVLPRLGSITGGWSGLRSLLFSVAHARLVDDVRRRARRPDPLEYDAGTDARWTPSAEEGAAEALGTARVLRLVGGLPEAQRDVVVLRVLADLSLEETAAVLGRSPGAVKQLQRRGLLALRAAVEAEGVAVEGVTR